jgi:hypothetical protein
MMDDVELRDRLRRIEYKTDCLGTIAIAAAAIALGTYVGSELRADFDADSKRFSVQWRQPLDYLDRRLGDVGASALNVGSGPNERRRQKGSASRGSARRVASLDD